MRSLWEKIISVPRYILFVAMVAALLFSIGQEGPFALAAKATAIFPDVQGHWASGSIARLADLGIIRGDSRGFRPDDPITMAEMAVLLNNLLGFTALSGKPGLRAGTGPWYEQAFDAARLAGLLNADGLSGIEPEDPLTWEQAAVMLAAALGVEENAGNETSFEDAGQINAQSQLLIFGIEADGYMKDVKERIFSPIAFATRAQVVSIIDRAVQAFFPCPGEFSGSVKPSEGTANCVSIVRAGGVTLKNMVMDGSLIAAEGLTGGELTLDNSALSGNLLIRGGSGTVVRIINGSQVRGRVSLQGAEGIVQLFSSGAEFLSVDVKTQALLEGSFLNACAEEGSYMEVDGKVAEILVTGKARVFIGKGAEVGTIMLYERAAGSVIEVEGTVAAICTEAQDVSISAGRSSKITLIEIMSEAVGADLFLNRYSEVARVVNEAAITISGSGKPRAFEGSGQATFTQSVIYDNSQYGFSFNLPDSWKGYSIVLGEWHGSSMSSSEVTAERSGPIISIRHPQWKEEDPRQDIPIMVLEIADWDDLQKGLFHIGAAPIGPSELGRNSKFVFALLARYNFGFQEGYEEVERIFRGDPLHTTSPGL